MKPQGWEKKEIVARAADQFLKDSAVVDKVVVTTTVVS
jgi:hypothetical protein